jgi:hypothetical protein
MVSYLLDVWHGGPEFPNIAKQATIHYLCTLLIERPSMHTIQEI